MLTKLRVLLLAALFAFSLQADAFAQALTSGLMSAGPVVTRFTTTGANTLTIPATVNAVEVLEACNGGGGGGGGQASASTAGGGGGGAGGAIIGYWLPVTPLSTLTITIPAGGAHGAAGSNGSPGSNLTITGGLTAFPNATQGGSGGGAGAAGVGGKGGLANAGSTNDGVAAGLSGNFPNGVSLFQFLNVGGGGAGGGNTAGTGSFGGGGGFFFTFAAGSGNGSGGGGGGSAFAINTAPPAAGVAGTNAPANSCSGGPGGGANAIGGDGGSGYAVIAYWP